VPDPEEKRVNDAYQKAAILVEALGWIRQFRDRLVVIKLGGSALEDEATVRRLLNDVIFMEAVGMHPVLIHGGGKSINAAMKSAGIEPRWVQGRRYTDEETLEIVSKVLAGEICVSLCNVIRSLEGRAMPLSYLTCNCLLGERLLLPDQNGPDIDLGFVGQVTGIDGALIRQTCEAGIIPVIPSIALDQQGQKYNVNADTAAAAIARLLGAEKLIFLSDVPGIFRDRHDPQTLIRNLTTQQCRDLIADGTIDSGMIPKVEAATEALAAGVKKVHIIDGREPHSLLLEIYSDTGIGTEIVA
jgi:acetylglutamate kinase